MIQLNAHVTVSMVSTATTAIVNTKLDASGSSSTAKSMQVVHLPELMAI